MKLFVLLAFFSFALVAVTYCTIPRNSCVLKHFATLIVLGCPPDPNGEPSSEERERVQEAVREFHAGRADNIIVTGGSPHSRSAEAVVMATLFMEAGVPATKVLIEPQARNTIENIFFSYELMRPRGWTSAEVISSPSHIARVSLILEHYPICWQTKASKWPPEYDAQRIGNRYIREVPGTTLLRWFGFRRSAYIASILASGFSRTKLDCFEAARCI